MAAICVELSGLMCDTELMLTQRKSPVAGAHSSATATAHG